MIIEKGDAMKRTTELEKILYKALQEAEPCLRQMANNTKLSDEHAQRYILATQHVKAAMAAYKQEHVDVSDVLADKIRAAFRNDMPKSKERYTPADQLTIGSVAKLARVGRGTAQNWVNKGFLKAYKLPSGHTRVRVDDLMIFLEQQQMPIPVELMWASN